MVGLMTVCVWLLSCISPSHPLMGCGPGPGEELCHQRPPAACDPSLPGTRQDLPPNTIRRVVTKTLPL